MGKVFMIIVVFLEDMKAEPVEFAVNRQLQIMQMYL